MTRLLREGRTDARVRYAIEIELEAYRERKLRAYQMYHLERKIATQKKKGKRRETNTFKFVHLR